jgi:DinB superfamily
VGAQELAVYRRQFEEIQQQAGEVTEGLNEARFNWRPSPTQWSIEECLAHLTMVGQWEIRAIEQAIEQGKQRGLTGQGPFEYGPIDRFIVNQTEPPVRTAMPAPRHFTPLHGQPVTAVLPTFYHVQSQLMLQLERADGLDLRRVKVATPISRFLKMSLGAMFAQIAAHERRHLEQARRVREKLPR